MSIVMIRVDLAERSYDIALTSGDDIGAWVRARSQATSDESPPSFAPSESTSSLAATRTNG